MIIKKLHPHEKALIEIIRCFEFLTLNGFSITEIVYGSREYPSLVYKNNLNKRKVHVIGGESFSYSVQIQRSKMFSLNKKSYVFEISDYYHEFNYCTNKNGNYSLSFQAEFIKKHLMPIILGEKWIDELIDIK